MLFPAFQDRTIVTARQSCVRRTFHPALNLQALNTHLFKLFCHNSCFQVAHGEEPPFLASPPQRREGSRYRGIGRDGEIVSANLGTRAAVGTSPTQLFASSAKAAEAVAERPMDEYFQLDIRTCSAYSSDLLNGELTGKYDPFEAQPLKLFHPFDGMDGKLGASMQFQVGELLSDEVNQAKILDDDTITTDEVNLMEQSGKVFPLIVRDQCVHRHIDALILFHGNASQLCQILKGKICRPFSG
ncbi:hypothetical protein SDC9_94756 [bioreactor metagenome]|uniref:Uncharacterized protein n=1 Tax=bioreactor metagenome TaxID=1076179 RepID=A0A645A4B7_9ZZZZ